MYRNIDSFVNYQDIEPNPDFDLLDRSPDGKWFDGFYQLNYYKAVTLTMSPYRCTPYRGTMTNIGECPTHVQYSYMRRIIENIKMPKKNFKFVFFFEYTNNGVIHAHGVIESDSKHKIINWLASYKRQTQSFTYVKTITNTNTWEEYCQKDTEHLPLKRES